MSMKQSSSFEESCQSNVVISWSMVVMRFDSLCVACKVSVYACMILCTCASLDRVADYGWSVREGCCSLFVNCISSAVDVD